MLQSAYPEIQTRVNGRIQTTHTDHKRIAGNVEDQTVWPAILSQSGNRLVRGCHLGRGLS